MRLLIDATSLLLRSAGVKSYTYHWMRAMREIAGPDEILGFPYVGAFGGLMHEGSMLSRAATIPRLALLYAVNFPGNPMLEWIARRADIFHVSNQLRRNIPKRTRVTATVHDLTCWTMPELHTPANVLADKAFAEHTLKRADGLIAVSENTRQDAIRMLGINEAKIRTIHSGVPDEYFDAKPIPRARPYVLFVGTIEPRKNIPMLLDAWEHMRYRREYDLVIAGATGWGSEATLARLRAGVHNVHHIGYIREKDLPGLTAGATAFIYPSLYEGFGFPVAQAMAAGVPVITSNNSCLPEVAGDGALYVEPKSPSSIYLALEKLLESAELRAQIAARGRRQAEKYRWRRCAEQSLQWFRDLIR
ncbi:MAG TPA: glycosyltransferase family 1 protein [Bryobacteraceae bacterium]|nr:glycosyltransferase family 1 protein [Bryobacteraceae bacterium]